MTKHHWLIGTFVGLMACGGGNQPSTTPDPDPTGGGGTDIPHDNDPSQIVSTETLDQIQRAFQRKGPAVSRCLATVVDNKELPKNSRGKITIEVEITRSGAPGAIKILKASLDNKSLHDCVLEKVKEIQFPEVPKAFPTTYTYAFEAM